MGSNFLDYITRINDEFDSGKTQTTSQPIQGYGHWIFFLLYPITMVEGNEMKKKISLSLSGCQCRWFQFWIIFSAAATGAAVFAIIFACARPFYIGNI